MFQLLGEINKELDAKKGITKLMILHIRGDIDIDSMLITNISPASPSRGMQVVLISWALHGLVNFQTCVNDPGVSKRTKLHQHPFIASVHLSHV
jgi:hypothetical protein